MRTELISIETDTVPLDGAWYEPDSGATSGAVMLCHGNTMNFYTGAPRFLPPALTELGFACLAFNRRGHDILSICNNKENPVGAAFQTTAEGIADNEYAASWVCDKGFAAPVLIGHSNGGFLAVQHAARHPETPAVVLLSAHAGGDREKRIKLASYHDDEKTPLLTAKAEKMIAEGRGDDLMMLPTWIFISTAQSYIDRQCLPDTVETAFRISCPVLFIRGDLEPRDAYPAEDFAAQCGGSCDVEIVENCDHFYNGCEDIVTGLVVTWLKKNLLS